MMNQPMVGLGLRKELVSDFVESFPEEIDFLEVAPENWIGVGGKRGENFRLLTEKHRFFCHGLSLSIGGPTPLDFDFLHSVKKFLDQHKIEIYSEHLSYCSDRGHLYDLLPIPFTEEAVRYVSSRIRHVQELLERTLVIENVSYYLTPPISELTEIEFLLAVLEESNCQLLFDVNNLYVNSINHRYDPVHFLNRIPAERVRYFHLAGHYDEADDLKIDTHGADVIHPVFDLLKKSYEVLGVFPTLLERDFNIPPIEDLLKELRQIRSIQKEVLQNGIKITGKSSRGRNSAVSVSEVSA